MTLPTTRTTLLETPWPVPAARCPLSEVDLSRLLPVALPDWALCDGALERRVRLNDYPEVLGFAQAVGWLAHRLDHHPDMTLSYRHCTLRWSTHSASGISLCDLICAAQVDRLLERPGDEPA